MNRHPASFLDRLHWENGSSRERKLQKWIDLEEACDRRLDMLAASFRTRFGDELGF